MPEPTALELLDIAQRITIGGDKFTFDELDALCRYVIRREEGVEPVALDAIEGWHECPVCGKDFLAGKPQYCEDCGARLKWRKDA